VQRHSLALTTRATGHPATHLCGATINRILSAVSSFYDYLVVTEQYTQVENPILRRYDTCAGRFGHPPLICCSCSTTE